MSFSLSKLDKLDATAQKKERKSAFRPSAVPRGRQRPTPGATSAAVAKDVASDVPSAEGVPASKEAPPPTSAVSRPGRKAKPQAEPPVASVPSQEEGQPPGGGAPQAPASAEVEHAQPAKPPTSAGISHGGGVLSKLSAGLHTTAATEKPKRRYAPRASRAPSAKAASEPGEATQPQELQPGGERQSGSGEEGEGRAQVEGSEAAQPTGDATPQRPKRKYTKRAKAPAKPATESVDDTKGKELAVAKPKRKYTRRKTVTKTVRPSPHPALSF